MSILPHTSEVLPEPSPIVGSAEEFEAAAQFLASLGSRFHDARRDFDSGASALELQESRHTAEMTRRLRSTVISGCDLSRESAEEARQALTRHAAQVERVHRAARAVIGSVEVALSHMADAHGTFRAVASEAGGAIELSWREPAPPLPSAVALTGDRGADDGVGAMMVRADRIGVLESRWRIAAVTWDDAREEIIAAVRRWEELVHERRADERALIASLARTSLGELIGDSGSHVTQENAVSVVVAGYSSARGVAGHESFEALLEGTLAPVDVARVWRETTAGLSAQEVHDLIDAHCCELASIDGIPFWVMDRASRATLEFALEDGLGERRRRMRLGRIAARMGFVPDEIDLREFERELTGIRRDLRRAERSGAGGVQLLALGRHDGAVTAAISFGDLDRVSRIGVLVSGMNSDVGGISDAFKAFSRIRERNRDAALVTWVGYRSPQLLEEPFQARASAGRLSLKSFLDGLSAAREGDPPGRTVLIGHSYGSNTAAEALKLTREPVDAFVTMGSAGLKPGTASEQLHAHELYATHAARDRIAPIGMSLHLSEPGPRVDPRDLEGVHVLSAEQGAGGRAVTSHFLKPHQRGGPDADDDRVGYLSPDSSTTRQLLKILEGKVR